MRPSVGPAADNVARAGRRDGALGFAVWSGAPSAHDWRTSWRAPPPRTTKPAWEAGFRGTATGIRSPATDPHEPPSEAKSGLGRGLFLLLESLMSATPGDPARLGAIRRDPCAHAPTVRPRGASLNLGSGGRSTRISPAGTPEAGS